MRVMGRASRVFVCVLAALLLGLGGVAGAEERETITIGYYEAGAGQGVFSQVMNRIIALFEEAHPEVRVETAVRTHRSGTLAAVQKIAKQYPHYF